MDAITRAVLTYAGLLVLFRITGQRTLGRLTSFDFVVLLLIGRATTGILLGNDYSAANAVLIIATLAAIQVVLSWLKCRSRRIGTLLDGVPVLLVADGQPLPDALEAERIGIGDVMQAARDKQGLMRLEQIRYAVLETTGDITIVPTDKG